MHNFFSSIGDLIKADTKEWREFLEMLTSSLASGIIIYYNKENFPIYYINSQFLQLLNYDYDEFIHTVDDSFFNYIHPDDRSSVISNISQQLSSTNSYQLQYRTLKKDGSIVWIKDIGKTIKIDDTTNMIVSICLDITEVIAIEKALERKYSICNEANDYLTCGICRTALDDSLTILYANDIFYKMFGYTDLEVAKKKLYSAEQVISPSEYSSVLKLNREHIEKKQYDFEYETKVCKNSGDIMWVLVKIHYDQLTNSALSILTDITQNKQTEELLRLNAEEMKIALQHTHALLVSYDISSKTLTQPQEIAYMFDLPTVCTNVPYSIAGTEHLAKGSDEEYIAFYESMLAGIPNGQCIVQKRHYTNVYKWYLAKYTMIYDKAKTPLRAIISYVDITEQHEREQIYEKWKQQYETQQINSLVYYEYNLTKDMFEGMDGNLCSLLPIAKIETFSGLISYVSNHYIFSEDREKYTDFFSRKSLLEHYYSGNRELQIEHRRLDSADKVFWANGNIQMIQDPYSNDVKCFILIKNIDAEKNEQLRLEERSQKDMLTGLLNRATAIEEINAAIQLDWHASHAFIIVDIDYFKQLNDTFGHAFGDKVLSELAGTLKSKTRDEDTVGRLGGDEFILFLRNINLNTSFRNKVENLRESLLKKFKEGLFVSGSLGIAIYPQDGSTFEDLYLKADVALYEAKRLGRNRCVFSHSDIQEEAISSVSLDNFYEKRSNKGNAIENEEIINNELYLAILQQTGTIVLEWIYESNTYYIAPEARIFAFAHRDISRSNGRFFIEDDLHPEDWPLITSTKNNVKKTDITIRLKKTDGNYLWCKTIRTLLRDEDGSTIGILITINDIDSAIRAKQSLEYQKTYDSLTGYSNFDSFKNNLEGIIQNDTNFNYALWYFDLRNFKFINDIYGYNTGDALLQYLAKIIADSSRDNEFFARISSDHFTSFVYYQDRQELVDRFEKIIGRLSDYSGMTGKEFPLEMIAGIYCIESTHEIMSPEDMMARAIIAQKSVKALHGSRFAFYNEEMRNLILHEKELEASMEFSLNNRDFLVFFQPLVDIQNGGGIVNAEALVRWKRNDVIMSPIEFIPLFEKNGFIINLDKYVFEETCRYLRSRIDSGKRLIIFSINVSKISIFQPDFIEFYSAIKKKYQIPDKYLNLECTETLAAENLKTLTQTMCKMRQHGFLFSLDDFGSGYSSPNLLKDIVADSLKLDMQFVQNELDNPRNKSIVSSMIRMAKILDMQVVAEGVETENQLTILQELGCDLVQGYFFSKPVPISQFEKIADSFFGIKLKDNTANT